MSELEKFAIDEMGVTLTKHQVKLITAWSEGKQIHSMMRAGWGVARDVMLAYINKGITKKG